MEKNILTKLPKLVLIILILVGIILIATTFLKKHDAKSENDKNGEEVKYLDTKILSLINSLNNIELRSYNIVKTKVEAKSNKTQESSTDSEKSSDTQNESEEGSKKEETEISKMEEENSIPDTSKIDWNTIEIETENLYSIWPSIVLDLYALDLDSKNILDFSNTLDETITYVRKKDKALSAIYIAKLYSYLPMFLDENKNDIVSKKTLDAKSNIINSYAFAQTENFEKMEEEIEKAESIFVNLVNDISLVNDKRKYNINKSYILIEELKNSLSTKDIGIFYIKYKNLLQEMNILF